MARPIKHLVQLCNSGDPNRHTPPGSLSGPAIVRAEANLLRFPLFALHTKGLADLDGVECKGKRVINGKSLEFQLTVTRNVADLYPGPLSRKVHFALLSMVSERGLPFENPVKFSWRKLSQRMGVCYSGKKGIESVKAAIRSTSGVEIRSRYARKCGLSGDVLPYEEETSHRLYQAYGFRGEKRKDGSTWDGNYVWLSEWYLENLNALYAGPVNYRVWQELNEKSAVASRLYEFLLFNLTGRLSRFRIAYDKLAQFLPLTLQRYESKAREQLSEPLSLLEARGVISQFAWDIAKGGAPLLVITRGPHLKDCGPTVPGKGIESFDSLKDVEVRELRHLRSPAYQLVRQFHLLWNDGELRPTVTETSLATEIIQSLGKERANQLLPKVVQRMRDRFPAAKSFGASRTYWREVRGQQRTRAVKIKREAAERTKAAKEMEKTRRDNEHMKCLESQWLCLTEEERATIEAKVLASKKNVNLRSVPRMFHALCLHELEAEHFSLGGSKEESGRVKGRKWEDEKKEMGG